MTQQEYSDALSETSYAPLVQKEMSYNDKLILQEEMQKLQDIESSLNPGSDTQSNRMDLNALAQRKQDRLSNKAIDLSNDDSNFMIKAKEAYNYVNDLWERDSTSGDLKANYMGKQHTMSNKTFEDVNATMDESKARQQELIDQYNNAEDDPNARHKVYQLRLQDGVDENGNPLYTYKTGIAESSVADRYKNQIAAQGYEILSEKGFAGAEDWENKWHGLKANIADITFDEGYNAKGEKIKDISNFGDGYSEIYNTQNFNQGISDDQIAQNMANSEAIAQQAAERRKSGYGRGSDSMIDAFQAGGLKTLADTGDVLLDILTPGNNTLLDEAKDQSNIDKYVGYNRKSADKAVGEAVGYFKDGQYARALWEVVKEPQMVAESVPMMIEMALPLPTKFTKAGKLYSEINNAKKANDVNKVAELTKELATNVSDAQKGIYKAAQNAGFLTAVASQTNNQIDERVKNNQEAGVEGGDSMLETFGAFASNFALLGLDRLAFNKITGLEGGKSALGDAFGFANEAGKKNILSGIAKTQAGLMAAGATEAAQEYVQTWGEIINEQLGTGKDGGLNLGEVLSSEKNIDEAIGGMLAGAAGGIHMRQASDAIEYGYNKVTGKESKLEAERQLAADKDELVNVMSGKRTADTIDPADAEGRKKASRNTLDAINRSGYKVLSEQAINDKVLDSGEAEVDFSGSVKNILTSMAKEYGELDASRESGEAPTKLQFETSANKLINNLMDDLNKFENREDIAKRKFGNDLSGVDSNAYLAEFGRKRKQELAEAIASLVSTEENESAFDQRFIDGVVSKFKKRMIDDELAKIEKKAMEQDFSFQGLKNDIDSESKQSGSNTSNVADEELTKKLMLLEPEIEKLKSNANILYTLSGGKDKDLAELINDLENAKNDNGIFNAEIKSSIDVANDIMNKGYKTPKGKRLSINEHALNINEDVMSFIDEQNQDTYQQKDKKVGNFIIKIENFENFAQGRSRGLDYYLDDEEVSKMFNGIEDSDKLEELGRKIGSQKDYKKLEMERLTEEKKSKNKSKEADYNAMNIAGMEKESRNFIAGSADLGTISSYIYEANMMHDKLLESAKDIDGFIKIEEQRNAEATKSGIKYKKAINSDKIETLKLKSESLKQSAKDLKKSASLYKGIWEATNNAKVLTDPFEIRKSLIDTAKKREAKNKGETKSKEPVNESDINIDEELETETEFDISNDLLSELPSEVNKVIDEVFSEDIGDKQYINRNSAIKVFSALGKLIKSSNKSNLLKPIRYIDEKLSYYKRDESDKGGEISLNKEHKDNSIVKAHELFHHLSLDAMKTLTKEEQKFLANAENVINDISLNESDSNTDWYKDFEMLKDVLSTGNKDRFNKELGSVLISNTVARRMFVDKMTELDKSKSKEYKQDLTTFINKLGRAYANVLNFLSVLFKIDKDYDKRNTVAYKDMIKFLGNALKDSQKRDKVIAKEKAKSESKFESKAEFKSETKKEKQTKPTTEASQEAEVDKQEESKDTSKTQQEPDVNENESNTAKIKTDEDAIISGSDVQDMIDSLENDLTFIDDNERRKGNFVAKSIVSSLIKKLNEDDKNREANINGLKVIIDSIKTIKDC